MSRIYYILSVILFFFPHFLFAQSTSGDMKIYNGEYCQIKYPKEWKVNENPGTFTADVFIGFSNGIFGAWIFRFEDDNIVNFKEAMTDVANRWREFADVDMSFESINGVEWCRHDIQMEMQGEKCRQISFYRQFGGYVYNVKFGNRKILVDIANSTINIMMNSFKIK